MVEIAYWSGTGNTEAMAQEIAAAAKAAGADVESVLMEDTTPDAVAQHDVILLGCPAMGSEELEDSVVEPFFTAIAPKLSGKKVGLSVPMAGEPVNGWTRGNSVPRTQALSYSVRLLSMKRPIIPKNAPLSVKQRPHNNKFIGRLLFSHIKTGLTQNTLLHQSRFYYMLST